jgi:bifunctional enzyme CysN/CysC
MVRHDAALSIALADPDSRFEDASELGAEKSMLRLLTCGSVGDGKSTLIGRLLYDTGTVPRDTLAALEKESKIYGTTGGNLDFALLVDGLGVERAQGITIDVAYRYFSTANRKFIVADAPGDEQYTRNMVTGASRCDLAVVLLDASKGILKQTRRHSFIANLMGIRHIVLAVNKMDLVGYSQKRFEEIVTAYRSFADDIGIGEVTPIPLSALEGHNLNSRTEAMAWYRGPTLLKLLETVDVTRPDQPSSGLRLPIQWVCRPSSEFRGYAGTVCSGHTRVGDSVVVMPSAQSSSIARIIGPNGDMDDAAAGAPVVVTLADEIDIGRGDVLCTPTDRPEVADQFAAHIVWMSAQPLFKGRPYLIQLGTQTSMAQVSEIKHVVSMDTLEKLASRKLEINDVAVCNISTTEPLVIEPYARCRELGGFILVDRTNNETVGAGVIQFGLRRAHNVHWQAINISKPQRAEIKGQKACCLWFTGLSGSGKSTIANQLEKRLFSMGLHTYILDGDNVRHGLNRDLGFTDADRIENIRRVAEVAHLMVDAGLITIVSFISPFRDERRFARERFDATEFLEVFVDTPLAECERRDPKGLYRKVRAGAIKNFTGISSPYEPPSNPECHLKDEASSPEEHVNRIFEELVRRGVIGGC